MLPFEHSHNHLAIKRGQASTINCAIRSGNFQNHLSEVILRKPGVDVIMKIYKGNITTLPQALNELLFTFRIFKKRLKIFWTALKSPHQKWLCPQIKAISRLR